jgi:small-conductance mechanosensitive channel
MFLSPSLLGAVATSATALLSLSFVFATTCQEVLGSCVFLFIKHPYDVGDYVVIDATELVVERISLLYTVFTRVQAAQSVQIPNIVLNSLWVDNVTKSGMFKEQTTIHVAFDTMPDSITLLKDEVQKALIPKGLVDITIGILSVVGMESLELQCISHFRMNRPDGALRAACRSCFMSTLVKALRETRIRGPEATAVATLQER